METLARKRVLIVEDDVDIRTILPVFLERGGYEPGESADGTEGLAKAESFRPDVILLDVAMPDLDGYEVCRVLKENPETKTIPVIFVTGSADAELNRRAYQAGAVACITKPFHFEAIVAVLEAALASAERQALAENKGGASEH